MASQTLVQYLEPGADTAGAMNREVIETFLAGGAITANALVSLDLSQSVDGDKLLYVVAADSGTAAKSIAIGVALAGAASGGLVKVLLRGIATVAIDGSGTAVAAGDALCLSGTKLVKAVAGEGIVAQSLGAVSTDTTGDVYVLPRF